MRFVGGEIFDVLQIQHNVAHAPDPQNAICLIMKVIYGR